MFAGVAQLAEQLICNQQVAGSSPITSSIAYSMEGFPSGQREQTVNPAVADFDGSNPSPSTIIEYADMAELADAYGSGPYESNLMKVQVLLSRPRRNEYPSFRFFYFLSLPATALPLSSLHFLHYIISMRHSSTFEPVSSFPYHFAQISESVYCIPFPFRATILPYSFLR